MDTNKTSLIGLRIRQVVCRIPGLERFVGRVSMVEDEFTDEKGVNHVYTEDGVWCPRDLVQVLAEDVPPYVAVYMHFVPTGLRYTLVGRPETGYEVSSKSELWVRLSLGRERGLATLIRGNAWFLA